MTTDAATEPLYANVRPPRKPPPILLNVGATWDLEQLDAVDALNQECPNAKVVEVYGSMGSYRSARSSDRVPDWDLERFQKYAARARELGITIKWTMNASCLGRLDDFDWGKYRPLIATLKEAGIHDYIVTVPLLIGLIIDQDPDARIEVSTINRITSVEEIVELHVMGAESICWDVMQNRNFRLLKAGIAAADRHGVTIELIANEFCTFMCPHRNTCYNLSSHDSTRETFDGYPFSSCIAVRDVEPWRWVTARFILPSDLRMYQELGVSKFKVTGRTHSTQEVLRVLGYYMHEADPDNLLDLWHHINILVHDKVDPPSGLFIATEVLRREHFINHFLGHGHECAEHECGHDCSYCPGMFDRAVQYYEKEGDSGC